MQITAILSIILFVTTSHIWCDPDDDVKGVKALIIAHRDNKVAVVFPNNCGPKSKGGNGKGGCFPRGKPKEKDNKDPFETACRELREETGLDVPVENFSHVGSYGYDTHIFMAEVPYGVEFRADRDTHDRKTEWVNPYEVRGCVDGRPDSVAAWSDHCGNFDNVVDESEFEGYLD